MYTNNLNKHVYWTVEKIYNYTSLPCSSLQMLDSSFYINSIHFEEWELCYLYPYNELCEKHTYQMPNFPTLQHEFLGKTP